MVLELLSFTMKKFLSVTIQMEPFEQYFMLYKVTGTFKYKDGKILKCDHSNKSYWAVLSCGTVNHAVQGGSTFKSEDEFLKFELLQDRLRTELSGAVVFL